MLLFNLRMKLFPGKLRSKWSGPFEVLRMTSHGAFELWKEDKSATCLVNGHRVKHYWVDRVERHKTSITFEEE